MTKLNRHIHCQHKVSQLALDMLQTKTLFLLCVRMVMYGYFQMKICPTRHQTNHRTQLKLQVLTVYHFHPMYWLQLTYRTLKKPMTFCLQGDLCLFQRLNVLISMTRKLGQPCCWSPSKPKVCWSWSQCALTMSPRGSATTLPGGYKMRASSSSVLGPPKCNIPQFISSVSNFLETNAPNS